MKLKPLEQFICDRCDEVILKPEDGWIEWISEIGKEQKYLAYGFKIVHHTMYSPLRGGCYHYSKHREKSDMHLNRFLEEHMQILLGFLDKGPYHYPEYNGPEVKDIRELVELIRRITIPYYEQARLYFGAASADGIFDGANPISIYSSDTLEYIVNTYSE